MTSDSMSLGRGKSGESVTSLDSNDLGVLRETSSEGSKDGRGGKILGGESVRSIVVSAMDTATPSTN